VKTMIGTFCFLLRDTNAQVRITDTSKGFALTWYRARTWYSSPARPFAAPDDPRLVTGQQGSPSPACQQLSRARNVCSGGSTEGSTKLKHGTKLGRTLATTHVDFFFRICPCLLLTQRYSGIQLEYSWIQLDTRYVWIQLD